MLRHIPPVLSPSLLYALRAMGHGDELVIADANFPATRLARECIRLDGVSATEALEAILHVLPLDTFEPGPCITMEVVDDPESVPAAVQAFQQIVTAQADSPVALDSLDRFAFYERARNAFVIVQTSEQRLYGNIILRKGVIGS